MPIRQVKSIIVLYLLVLCVGVLGIWIRNNIIELPVLGHYFQPIDILRLVFLYIACTLAYGISYTAIEAHSPSLEIVRRIHQAGRAGIDPNSIKQSLGNEILLFPRLSDLQRDLMIRKVDARYRVTRKGQVLQTIFRVQRRIFQLPRGG